MKKPTIKIEIVSDVVCPWCYIGKRRLERAIAELRDEIDFNVSWLPFELNPDMPKEGKLQKEYLLVKFGGAERYQQLTSHVAAIALEEGLVFNYPDNQVLPNTLDAHRVIRLAGTEGKQAAVKEAFMKAYFTDGVDLSKKTNLIKVAEDAGLEHAAIKSLLDSDDGIAEVIHSGKTLSQRGVSGVPFYIVNDAYGISGAQAPEVFVKAFRELAV